MTSIYTYRARLPYIKEWEQSQMDAMSTLNSFARAFAVVSSSSYDMYPPPHINSFARAFAVVSSSSYDMYPPPHMTTLNSFARAFAVVSSSSYDMYPPPHLTCILLLI